MTSRAHIPRRLIHVLVAALALRCVALSAWSLSTAEGDIWWRSTQGSLAEIWGGPNTYAPLWQSFLRVWTALIGDGEAALRMPSAIAGVLAVWLTWRLCLRLLHEQYTPGHGGFGQDVEPEAAVSIGLWTAGLVACAAFTTERAQDVLPHSTLLACALGLHLCYLRWMDTPTRRHAVTYAALACCALLIHEAVGVVIVAHAIHAMFLKRSAGPGRSRKAFVLAVVISLVPYVLWLVLADTPAVPVHGIVLTTLPAEQAHTLLQMGTGPGLLVVDGENEANGLISVLMAEPLSLVLVLVLFGIPLALGIATLKQLPGVNRFLIVTVLTVLILSLVSKRHADGIATLTPLLLFLAVVGPFASRSMWVRRAGLIMLVILTAIGMAAYHGAPLSSISEDETITMDDEHFAPEYRSAPGSVVRGLHHDRSYAKTPWREVHKRVAKLINAQPHNDLVVLSPASAMGVWTYYDRPKRIVYTRDAAEPLIDTCRTADRIALIDQGAEAPSKDDNELWRALLQHRASGAVGTVRAIVRIPSIRWRRGAGIHIGIMSFR